MQPAACLAAAAATAQQQAQPPHQQRRNRLGDALPVRALGLSSSSASASSRSRRKPSRGASRCAALDSGFSTACTTTGGGGGASPPSAPWLAWPAAALGRGRARAFFWFACWRMSSARRPERWSAWRGVQGEARQGRRKAITIATREAPQAYALPRFRKAAAGLPSPTAPNEQAGAPSHLLRFGCGQGAGHRSRHGRCIGAQQRAGLRQQWQREAAR